MTALSNGGPPLADDVGRMNYVLWHIRDFLTGVRGMKFAEVGAYTLVLMHLYDQMGDVPDDDRWMAIAMGVDIRTWKTAKARLLELGKITISGGRIRNQRVEDEITAYCAKVRRKQDAAEAAKKREAEKRQNARVVGNTRTDSLQSLPDSPASLLQVLSRIERDLSEKHNKINGGAKKTAPESGPVSDQFSALDRDKKEKKEKEEESKQQPSVITPRAEMAAAAERLRRRLLDVANGAIANEAGAAGLLITSPILAWMEAGADPDADIVPAVRAVAERTKQRGMQRIRSWDYFNSAVAEAVTRRRAGLPAVAVAPTPTQAKAKTILRRY